MYEIIFTFRSLTRAQQASTLLHLNNISSSVVHAPHALNTGGCGFAVQVHGADGTASAMLFKRNHIDYLRSFRKISGLSAEEVFL